MEEALDVGDFDGWAAMAEVGLDPALLRLACRDNRLRPPQEEPLYRPDNSDPSLNSTSRLLFT